MWISPAGNTIKHMEKILTWHVLDFRQFPAVTTAMAATHITSQGTFPEQLSQGMFLEDIPTHQSRRLQSNALA
jgi:hypothetical protein